MKLKQRVVTVLLVLLIATSLFIISIQLSKTQPDSPRMSRDTTITSSSSSTAVAVPSKNNSNNGHHPLTTLAKREGVSTEASPSPSESRDPWEIWREWVEPDSLYPIGAFHSSEMNHILITMATSPITSFDLGYKGTQLKATALLGQQRTVFKPKRYERDHVISGDPYAGFDRHNGEIAGFHMDGILGLRMAPPVVGRKINLTELKPVTSEKLLKTYFTTGNNVCFYGVCYYCKRAEGACGDGDIMEGSLSLWLPQWYSLKWHRHPYQRTYKYNRKARWETDAMYCQHILLKPGSEYFHGILEFTDTAIYDFLMGNADRHHYETYSKSVPHGRLLHFDNGKTFGNPGHDELSILAPLRQCCRVRRSTWVRLKSLAGQLADVLDESLKRDPLYPILTASHLKAIDRRHGIVLDTIAACIADHSMATVVVEDWT